MNKKINWILSEMIKKVHPKNLGKIHLRKNFMYDVKTRMYTFI